MRIWNSQIRRIYNEINAFNREAAALAGARGLRGARRDSCMAIYINAKDGKKPQFELCKRLQSGKISLSI